MPGSHVTVTREGVTATGYGGSKGQSAFPESPTLSSCSSTHALLFGPLEDREAGDNH
ncbi:unnamed protein product [Protopolystoma xenopodis]|uniref:Uncharacterized protein n=1 Tax=Protopolystoma xenopodis TaxID=117903 RepID=A0A3S5BE11_9PLAT|nr:unnamed protein product [Protopolystoma xenopodis]